MAFTGQTERGETVSYVDGKRYLYFMSVLWPLVQDELGAALIEESRENYLRYALASWTAQQDGSARNPDRAISALDVLGLLFEH